MKCGSVRSGCPQCPFGGWVGGEGRSEGRGWWREAVVAAAAAIKSHPESSTLATCSFSKGFTSSPKWEFLTDELSGPQAPWIAEMLLGPMHRFCYSLANCLLPPSFWLFLWSWELLWAIYHGRELSWLASFAVGPPLVTVGKRLFNMSKRGGKEKEDRWQGLGLAYIFPVLI